MSPSDIKDLAIDFWARTGDNPTHLLLNEEQYNKFNACFVPKERNANYSSKIASYTLENGVELTLVKCEVMTNGGDYFLPQVVRVKDGQS